MMGCASCGSVSCPAPPIPILLFILGAEPALITCPKFGDHLKSLTTEKQVEKGISEIVGALTDPIIVFPGGWGDTLPDWLKTAITLERMIGNMRALKGDEPIGTDAESLRLSDDGFPDSTDGQRLDPDLSLCRWPELQTMEQSRNAI